MSEPDHRQLGRELGIFTTDDLVGAGLPLWLPAGSAVRAALERYIVEEERRAGYQHVYTPELAKRSLYEKSGHWDHFHDDMYPTMRVGGDDVVLRPMNCPHHILVYAASPRARRDLPLRIAELGTMFRYERSGVVGGLSRVRRMTLNDGHVFCPPEVLDAEIELILRMVERAYATLGIPSPTYRLSLRGEGGKYVDNPPMWDRAEAVLRDVLTSLALPFSEASGEAAFYGPKIDLQVRDPQGREETLSTVQVDFHLPEQFNLTYSDGSAQRRPVMVHRSIVSTMERMVAHLLEVHDGALPVWLSPVQAVVLPVVDDASIHAAAVRDLLLQAGLRADLDDRDATLASRIRDAQLARVPYMVVIGRRELDRGSVAVRLRDGRQLGELEPAAFAELVAQVDRDRLPTLVPA